ncbi:sensor histidine kinase [Marinilabilia rubra]|uniref:histidine kinase n=1 Tax=Marinilabilia rubra TaxID=2162893 RepID=A0A2U2BBT3_9BACT|nr:PAS domain-containing protein [Marinilabilia rubra]PWE00519.1 PAS domain-containing sensor histidine kinase [Marinilabilia rubra]
MHHVQGFPPTALDTLKMLSSFTGSHVMLTVEVDGSVNFIWSASPNSKKSFTESDIKRVLEQTAPYAKESAGSVELANSDLIEPFQAGLFFNLTSRSLSGFNRLCLLKDDASSWDDMQKLLIDQTRMAIEKSFENFFFDEKPRPLEEEDRFRLLFEFSPVGIFFYSTQLKISSFNERLISTLGASTGDLLNFDLNNIQDPSILPALKAPLNGDEGFYEGIYNTTISKESVHLVLKTAPIFNQSKEVTGGIGIIHDDTERIKTLRALKESKDRLRVLINATPDVICFKDAEGKWMEANESIQQLFRLKDKEFLFKEEGYLETLVPELKDVFQQCALSDKEAWEKRQPVMAEESVPLPDGRECKLDVIKTPVFDDTGRRKGIVILGRDITARKITEERLRESEERFRIVATHTNDIIYEWNPTTDKMSWFGKFSFIGPFKEPPSTFEEFSARIHEEDRFRIVNFWTNRFPKNEEWFDEFRVEMDNRAFQYYKGSGIMIFKDGLPQKVIGTFTNITQEKKLIYSLHAAVDEANQNQARITGLLSVIPDLIFVFDKEGVIKDYHAENEEDLYLPPNSFIDQKIDNIFPENIANLTHQKIAAVQLHKSLETYEYEMGEDENLGIFESRMVYVNEDRFMTIVRDVTHARKVERDLIEAKEQAERSDRLKSAFLANMSHEIRTPMNGILGFSELLRTKDLPEEDRDNCVDVIVKSGQQLLAIINDVLEVSQLETGQVNFLPDRVNLNRLTHDLARFFEVEAVERNVELRYHVPEDDLFCLVDGGKITQVFNNLISNAFKFTSPGGHVVFGFEPDGDRVRFFVHDDGIGIAAKHHKIIFERFGQVLKVGAQNRGGTGLGLSICKSLVELMEGNIWVESAAGHGASFFFTLPVQ